jgi:heptosyltransferase II
MTNKGLSKHALYALDRLTDFSPTIFPRILQTTLVMILGNRYVFSFSQKRYGRILKRVKAFDKILVLGDIGIGDAVNVQQAVNILRDLFPDGQIDYLCHKTGGDLLSALPAADHVFRVYEGYGVASRNEHLQIRSLLKQHDYDVILNFSPFVHTRSLRSKAVVLDLYVPMAAYVMRLWRLNGGPKHVSSMLRVFLQEFFAEVTVSRKSPHPSGGNDHQKPSLFKGNIVYLPHDAIEGAQDFLKRQNLADRDRLVFFNPDGTCRYSQIPLSLQIQIIGRLLESEDINAVLIGGGHSDVEVEERIIASLPGDSRRKLFLVPSQPLPGFAAIIDACDLFISGDGGPVHIAAAKKVPISGHDSLRNCTAVVSIFGASDSRMYGYDSELPGHVPSYQNAPSKVFVGSAPCRNITCINKLGKTCREVRCFQGLKADVIVSYVKSYCRELRTHENYVNDRKEIG